jgi:hypothetical protein
MAGHELDQRLRIQLTSRDFEMLREMLGFVENLVRN